MATVLRSDGMSQLSWSCALPFDSKILAELSLQPLDGSYKYPSIAWPCKLIKLNATSSTGMACFVDQGEDYSCLGSFLADPSPSGLLIDLRLFKEALP